MPSSSAEPVARPAPTDAPRARGRRRRIVALALLVASPALLFRAALLPFEVSSPSMEPLLATGDRLLALRDVFDPRPKQRFDVGFFDRSVDASLGDDVESLVKRVVSWGDEWLEIRDGDVWTGDDPARLALARKPDALAEALLVPVHACEGLAAPWTFPDAPADGRVDRLAAGQVPVMADFSRAVRDGLSRDGQEEREGSTLVADTALRVVVGEGDGSLVLVLREGADTFRALLAPAARGGAVLAHNLGGAQVAAAPGFPGLHPGQTVLFANVDDRVRLAVDGVTLFAYEHASGSPAEPGFLNAPRLGVVDGERVLRSVEVLRDVHYTAVGDHGTQPGGPLTPCRVGPGMVFLLGDDSARSRDGRHFGPVPVERLLGRPVFCYAPSARAGPRDATGRIP